MLAYLFNDPIFRAMTVALLSSVSCALVGCFLVLRKNSMMGDALTHAVLPGLVVALLISGSTGAGPMLLGAFAAGLATTFLTRLADSGAGIAHDASLGVVYTSLFALGVVLVKLYADDLHFDFSCVFEGSLTVVANNTVEVAGMPIPRALFSSVAVLSVVVFVMVVLWKEWILSTFDPSLAAAIDFKPAAMSYLLMILVSITAMTSFESVGSILVVAMLIAPAATAQLLVDRLKPMLLLSAAIAVAATLIGYKFAERFDVSPAGSMAMWAGVLYSAAAVFSPKYGVASRFVQNVRLALRVRREDLLARLYRAAEADTPQRIARPTAVEIAGGGWLGQRAVRQLLARGEASLAQGDLKLTPAGETAGKRLVRSHRLWEAYLVEEVGLPLDHVHDPAHRIEHYLDEEIDAEIQRRISDSERDPHGRDIPN